MSDHAYGRPATSHTWGSIAKHVLCITPLTFAWFGVLDYASDGTLDDPGTPPITEAIAEDPLVLLSLLGLFVLPALTAYWLNTRLPDATEDIYHRFGRTSARWMAVNIPISIAAIFHQFVVDAAAPVTAFHVAGLWVIATMIVPGAYIGAILAAWWSQ